jgi:hypothetical protein
MSDIGLHTVTEFENGAVASKRVTRKELHLRLYFVFN